MPSCAASAATSRRMPPCQSTTVPKTSKASAFSGVVAALENTGPSLVAIAGQLAVEHPHHGLEVQAFAFGARMAVVGVGGLHAGGDLVGKHLQRLPGAHREHLVAADALEPVESAIGLCHRGAGYQHAVVPHE